MASGIENFSLSGRRALVTGSGQGIGYALARGLAKAGAAIVLNDIAEERVAKSAEVLRGEGFTVDYSVFDVTSHQAAAAAVAAIEDKVGKNVDSYGVVFDPKLKGKTAMEDAWINSATATRSGSLTR